MTKLEVTIIACLPIEFNNFRDFDDHKHENFAFRDKFNNRIYGIMYLI